MFFSKRALIFSALALAALVVVDAEPEPRRRSKVASNFKENNSSALAKEKVDNREGKVFSLFNIVQFKNGGCRSTSTISGGGTGSTNRNGTCFRMDECASKGGSVAGSCAAGFGVCCVFLVSTSGATVRQNCTYIRNPNFPNSYDGTSQVSYNIQKCDRSVCSLRLDFESFTIQGTGNTAEVDSALVPLDPGGVCLDTFDVSTNTGSNIPTICGQNTGQHMYVDIGNLASDTAQLSFAFNGDSTNRQWEIKVTQIPCNTQGQYSICIRQEAGFCCVEYIPCLDAMSYSLDTNADMKMSKIDSECSLDFITIEGATGTCANAGVPATGVNKFCGDKFNLQSAQTVDIGSVCDCTGPFQVDIFTDNDVDMGDMGVTANKKQSRGVCLEYRQIPC
eukprot:maker-scaffold664_size116482-snap-gene-0.22 protein:Tk03080 transcript:maker-scaffold664_size116482-snap-gene-0.22-mRNA-1 annotation:"hypothetical protein SINV_00302"